MRRKDARRFKEEAGVLLGTAAFKTVVQAEVEDGTLVYILDGEVRFARRDNTLFPTLVDPGIEELPSVVVDMGAVPFVCNGADVMAPGVVEVMGEFDAGELVIIRDVRHRKALAVCLTLLSSGEMRSVKKGKVLRNLHCVGDRLWNVLK